MVELPSMRPADGASVAVKWEGANPTGSLKDRMALAMIEVVRRPVRRPQAAAERIRDDRAAYFTNEDQLAGYEGLGREIVEQRPDVDEFVMIVGTGGSVMGTARALDERGSDAEITVVEPTESPVLSDGTAGAHGVQGPPSSARRRWSIPTRSTASKRCRQRRASIACRNSRPMTDSSSGRPRA